MIFLCRLLDHPLLLLDHYGLVMTCPCGDRRVSNRVWEAWRL